VRDPGRRLILQGLLAAGLGILANGFLSSTSALADACSDLKNQYNSAFQIYQSSKFQFPDDCARAQDYFRSKREQAQSLVSVFHAASQTTSPSRSKRAAMCSRGRLRLLRRRHLRCR